jgi:arginine decarboxylase-like protein
MAEARAEAGEIDATQAGAIVAEYEQALDGYTYLRF